MRQQFQTEEESGLPSQHAVPRAETSPVAQQDVKAVVRNEKSYSAEQLLAALKRNRRFQQACHLGSIVIGIPAGIWFTLTPLLLLLPPNSGSNPWVQKALSLLTLLTPFRWQGPAIILPPGQATPLPTPGSARMHIPNLAPPDAAHVVYSTISHIDIVTPLVLTLFCMILILVAKRQQQKTARLLATYDDLNAVGPLAEALAIDEKKETGVAATALIGLLPRLQATDASLLNEEQRACLRRALTGKNTDLTVALLNAYRQIGDSKDLPVVARLAAGKSKRARQRLIQEAARECIPFLRQRVDLAEAARTLLRGASPRQDNSQESLLRAAQGTGDTDPEQLLRASPAGDNNTPA